MGIRRLPLKTLSSYLKAVWETSPIACVGALLAVLLGGLFEGFGFLILIPVLKFIGVGSQQTDQTGLLGTFNTFIDSLGIENNPTTLLAAVFAILLLRALVSYLETHISSLIESRFLQQTRAKTYKALTSSNWNFLSRQSTSKMTHAITLQSENVALGTEFAVQLVATSISLLVGITLAALLSLQLTAIVLGIGAVVFLAMNFFNHRTARIARIENDKTAELFKQIEGHFSGLKAVKLLSAESALEENFLRNSQSLSDANRNASINDAQAGLFFQTASAGFLVMLVYLAIQFFPGRSLETILLIVIFSRLAPRANSALSYLRSLLGAVVEFERTQHLVEAANAFPAETADSISQIKIGRGLKFKDVGFKYDEAGKNVQVRDINLDIKTGTTLGIIGSSGEGKTTLIDLMCGLITPTKGTIQIDGEVLDENSRASWLKSVVYVPQDDYLFDGTLEENLLVAAPNASEQEINQCLQHAGINDFVMGQKEGLKTRVGSRGSMLSRGQRQRLCLARGLLLKPNFMILDEALNALNPQDETEILNTLTKISHISNLVIVSHRLSSLASADEILKIKGGTIAEKGTFARFSKTDERNTQTKASAVAMPRSN